MINVTGSKAMARIDENQVVFLYKNMFNSMQIAEKLGVSPQVIIKCLRANNVPIRTKWDYR